MHTDNPSFSGVYLFRVCSYKYSRDPFIFPLGGHPSYEAGRERKKTFPIGEIGGEPSRVLVHLRENLTR